MELNYFSFFFKTEKERERECVHVGRDEWAVCFREMDSEWVWTAPPPSSNFSPPPSLSLYYVFCEVLFQSRFWIPVWIFLLQAYHFEIKYNFFWLSIILKKKKSIIFFLIKIIVFIHSKIDRIRVRRAGREGSDSSLELQRHTHTHTHTHTHIYIYIYMCVCVFPLWCQSYSFLAGDSDVVFSVVCLCLPKTLILFCCVPFLPSLAPP